MSAAGPVSRLGPCRRPFLSIRLEPYWGEIGTESAQTQHRFTGIVIGVGGGTTPRPYRVGAETDSAGLGLAGEGSR